MSSTPCCCTPLRSLRRLVSSLAGWAVPSRPRLHSSCATSTSGTGEGRKRPVARFLALPLAFTAAAVAAAPATAVPVCCAPCDETCRVACMAQQSSSRHMHICTAIEQSAHAHIQREGSRASNPHSPDRGMMNKQSGSVVSAIKTAVAQTCERRAQDVGMSGPPPPPPLPPPGQPNAASAGPRTARCRRLQRPCCAAAGGRRPAGRASS